MAPPRARYPPEAEPQRDSNSPYNSQLRLTMDQALRNLVSIGLPIADVSNRLSRYAADYLGIEDRGRIARGVWADVVVFDRELALTATYVEGESIVEYA